MNDRLVNALLNELKEKETRFAAIEDNREGFTGS